MGKSNFFRSIFQPIIKEGLSYSDSPSFPFDDYFCYLAVTFKILPGPSNEI
jgi:hypothetical protein